MLWIKRKHVFAAVAGAMLLFADSPTAPPWQDASPLPQTPSNSAIVVFTGSNSRIKEGLKLYMDGLANKLLITGIEMQQADILQMLEDFSIPITRNLDGIDIDPLARTTYENAINTRQWLRDNPHPHVILVTSDFHMDRSLHLLRHELRFDPTQIHAQAVPTENAQTLWEKERRKLMFTRLGIPTHPKYFFPFKI
jgi:uncharacterized SAM-binding protein YcdF (DUF218 family)